MHFTRCEWATSWLLIFLAPDLVLGGTFVRENVVDLKNTKNHDATFGIWCFSWRNLICGSDGISYWNECLLEKAKQTKIGLEKQKTGACNDLECEDCDQDSGFGRAEICGSNRQFFRSKCLFECHQDTYPMLKESYYNCYEGHFPTKEETESTSTDVLEVLFEDYYSRLLDIIEDNAFQKINLEDMHFNLDVNGSSVVVVARKGWMKDLFTLKRIAAPFEFYAYSDTAARVKIPFDMDTLEIAYPKFAVTGMPTKIKGQLAIKVEKCRIELIADVKTGEDDCPVLQALSLRLAEINGLVVETSPQLDVEMPHEEVDGLVKEKVAEAVNNVLTPIVLPKFKEVGCLMASKEREEKRCYGLFQLKICF